MPATSHHVGATGEPIAPRWKLVPERGDYLWWNGTKYTTVAQWNGSSWTYTELQPQPTTDRAVPGDVGFYSANYLWMIAKSIGKALF